MTALPVHVTEHHIEIDADPEVVYTHIADVTRWPAVFGPTVHVELLEQSAGAERFQMWAVTNDEVKTWTSARTLDPVRRRITFRQERTQAPTASMGGEWIFEAAGAGRTRVLLRHDYTAIDDDTERVAWIERALDHNSAAELGSLKEVAEAGNPDELIFTFTDTVTAATTPDAAYAFIDRADRWPGLLPHVRRVELREDQPGVQLLEMETVAGDGPAHVTRSYRVGRAPGWMAYKQIVPPAVLRGHAGAWLFEPTPSGVAITARHTVMLRPGAAPGLRASVRTALGGNSLATLGVLRETLERDAPVVPR